jgi:hypothetical protein
MPDRLPLYLKHPLAVSLETQLLVLDDLRACTEVKAAGWKAGHAKDRKERHLPLMSMMEKQSKLQTLKLEGRPRKRPQGKTSTIDVNDGEAVETTDLETGGQATRKTVRKYSFQIDVDDKQQLKLQTLKLASEED